MRAVAQSVVVRNRMEELLRVQRTPEQQREIAIGRLDDVRDGVDGIAAVKRALICQDVLHSIAELYSRDERLRDTRQKRGVDDGRPPRTPM